MKRHTAETVKPNLRSETKLDPSTWHQQARLLARNDADSSTVIFGIRLVLVDGLFVLAWLLFGKDLFEIKPWQVFSSLFGFHLGLMTVHWLWTWAQSLKSDTNNTRQWTWKKEAELNEDLDGDGHIGQPWQDVTVRHGGKEGESIMIDLPPNSVKGAPILQPFGICAADLISFLFEVDLSRGLQERAWVGKKVDSFILPSGQPVTQGLFRQLLKVLSEQGMAKKVAGRWKLMVDPEVIARQIQVK